MVKRIKEQAGIAHIFGRIKAAIEKEILISIERHGAEGSIEMRTIISTSQEKVFVLDPAIGKG
jgi:hypothetical protein